MLMRTLAVVLEQPERLRLSDVDLTPPETGDLVVDVEVSGISSGTERLLWSGRMPPFPGLGYPLVPGYESVGRICETLDDGPLAVGDRVFVPGARCFRDVHALFGGAAARLVVPAERVLRVDVDDPELGALFALAATAEHAISTGARLPELIVGHGVLGRLLARITVARGGRPVVWETSPIRRGGAVGYEVVAPQDDDNRQYRTITDASGDPDLLDGLVGRLAKGGEIVLAGFYDRRLSFEFPPAFMREASFRIAAEWTPADLELVATRVHSGQLDLRELVSHRQPARCADEAYRTAFEDPNCLKMLLDWRDA